MAVIGKKIPLLVWDIDDVLNSLMEMWLADFAPNGLRRNQLAWITENPPCRIGNISMTEYLKSLDACRREKLYFQPPRMEILDFFRKYGQDFRHAVLSAVPLEFMERSAQWVLHWFGDWIQVCLFIPSKRDDRLQKSFFFRSKSEAIQMLGADSILIDDSPCNVEDVRQNGGNALLFPAPWNSAGNLPVRQFLSELVNIGVK